MEQNSADVIARVRQMEAYFDRLCAAADSGPGALRDPELPEMLRRLTAYYEGGQWLRDYELDEQGLLPDTLKRGVLSQDGVFNLLSRLAGDSK